MNDPAENSPNYPTVYDEAIRDRLQGLTLEELKTLSEESLTTANSGFLMANSETASREDFIEELSEIGDKAEWQINKIKSCLRIDF